MSRLPTVHPTVVHMLVRAADSAPEREAVACRDERLTYREYLRCVAWFADELLRLGVEQKRVALILGNSVDICVAMFATHASRAQAVPLNPLYTAREFRELLEDAAPHVVLYEEDKRKLIEPLVDELGIPHKICIGNGERRLTMWRYAADRPLPPLPTSEDLATLQYTGGTTGRAKGANLRHGAIATNVSQREALLPTRKDGERLLCVMPLFHIYAAAMCLHNMVYAAGTLVIVPRYTPDTVFDLLAAEGITIIAGSPTLFTSLLAHERFAQVEFSDLYVSYSGSAALPEELLRRWESATGAPVVEGYGQSETGPVLTFNPLYGVRKPGSVGVPLPDTDIQIVDLDNGLKPLAVGDQGEIRVRGPQMMMGYRNRSDENAMVMRDGWLYTGDVGEFDTDGYLYIRDRKKEMAKVSGFNVFPREIEEVLYLHPAVREAAAVRVPDEYRGELVKAFVALHTGASATAEELSAHCHENLAKYKVPATVSIVDELPKTAVGKIDKNRLRERLAQAQALSARS